MREIKFRGKKFDPIDGAVMDWIYGTPCFNEDKTKACMFHLVNGCETMTRIDPDTVGQYTGKYYEGDILKTTTDTWVVFWDAQFPGFKLQQLHTNSKEMRTIIPLCTLDLYELIGNVHDNPELTEESK